MRKQHEDYPSNTLHEQKKKRVLKAKMSVPMRDEDELVGGGKEMVERKPIKPNIRPPRVKKKSFLQRMGETFLGEDTGNVGQYIIGEVLIPAAKSTIQDMVSGGIEMLLFGESGGRSRSRRDRGKTVVSYGSYFKKDRYDRDSRETRRVPGYHNRLEGIVFESRGEAEIVLDGLVDLLDEYETVSIADFYELAGIENMIEFTDNGWGWQNLSRARVIHTRDGFEVEFPRPERLD